MPADQIKSLPECAGAAWREYEGELLGFLKSRTGNEADAQDLLQESFLRVLRQRDAFCAIDNPRAWLFRVARNLVIDRQRAQWPQAELHSEWPATEVAPDPVELLEECLQKNLAELTPEDRDVISACDLNGWTQARYAADRNLGLSATKSRLQRARQRLRARIVRNCGVRFSESGQVCCHVPRD